MLTRQGHFLEQEYLGMIKHYNYKENNKFNMGKMEKEECTKFEQDKMSNPVRVVIKEDRNMKIGLAIGIIGWVFFSIYARRDEWKHIEEGIGMNKQGYVAK